MMHRKLVASLSLLALDFWASAQNLSAVSIFQAIAVNPRSYSSPNVTGLSLGVGNIDGILSLGDEPTTFYADNAGRTWADFSSFGSQPVPVFVSARRGVLGLGHPQTSGTIPLAPLDAMFNGFYAVGPNAPGSNDPTTNSDGYPNSEWRFLPSIADLWYGCPVELGPSGSISSWSVAAQLATGWSVPEGCAQFTLSVVNRTDSVWDRVS